MIMITEQAPQGACFSHFNGKTFRGIEWVGEAGVVPLPKVALNFRNLQKYFNFTLTTAMISVGCELSPLIISTFFLS